MYREEFEHAVRECWRLRKKHSVQSGKHLEPLAQVVRKIFVDAGFRPEDVGTKSRLKVPGFYRSTKEWDLIVSYEPPGSREPVLAAAIEFKAQNGSIGKNMNNRIEEALGSAHDLRAAHQKGLFNPQDDGQERLFGSLKPGRDGVEPWLGYFFLLAEDAESERAPTTTSRFGIDSAFKGKTYKDRYVVFCRRLVEEGLYDAACFVTSSSTNPESKIDDAPGLSFDEFGTSVKERAHALRVAHV